MSRRTLCWMESPSHMQSHLQGIHGFARAQKQTEIPRIAGIPVFSKQPFRFWGRMDKGGIELRSLNRATLLNRVKSGFCAHPLVNLHESDHFLPAHRVHSVPRD